MKYKKTNLYLQYLFGIGCLLLSGIALGGAGIDTYWPINVGEQKTLNYLKKSLIITVESDDSGWYEDGVYHPPVNPIQYRFSSNTGAKEYYESRSDGVYLTLVSVNNGWSKVFLNPAVKIFDDNLLLNGGVRKASTQITQRYAGKYRAQFTVRVRKAGTVKVPAGTFKDCRSITVTENATLPDGRKVSASAMTAVLAPGVGIIRKLVKPGVWSQLVSISTVQPFE